MASIERTAYPRFRHEPNARKLQVLFTPTQDEIGFARSLVRDSNEHFFAAVLLLKCLQYLSTAWRPRRSTKTRAAARHGRSRSGNWQRCSPLGKTGRTVKGTRSEDNYSYTLSSV